MDEESIVAVESSALSEVDASETFSKLLDLIAGRLELESPHPATARKVRGARTVPREFVLALLDAAERRPDFSTLQLFDKDAARAVLESDDAYRLLAQRTAMFLASLNYTIEARWAKVTANALQVFSMASIMARDQANAELAAEVENLRKQLGRTGTRTKSKKKKGDDPGESSE